MDEPTYPYIPDILPPPPPPPGRPIWPVRQWQGYRQRSWPAKIGLGVGAGCGALLAICVIFSCVATAAAGGLTILHPAANTTRQGQSTSDTTISTPTLVMTLAPKATATALILVTPSPASAITIVTPVMTPTSTSVPRPTAIPTPRPTSAPTVTPTANPPTATPHPTPPPPTVTPVPPSSGVNGNPWGYNFSCCNLITDPPGAFCDYFSCIGNFWNGRGHVEQCKDGMYSKSGGISGSCSSHGGNKQALLAP